MKRSRVRNLFTRPLTGTIRRASRHVHLALEALEDRYVPSTFTVLNPLDDSSVGSLRSVVGQANSLLNQGEASINIVAGITGSVEYANQSTSTSAPVTTAMLSSGGANPNTSTLDAANLLSPGRTKPNPPQHWPQARLI